MNKNAAILNQPVKRKIAKHNTAILMHLKNSNSRAGKLYLHKLVYKDFTPPHKAAVRQMQLPLDKTTNRITKRAIDITVSLCMIIAILSWLIPLMALLIKITSKGPVFFLQKRSKQYGATFTCIKFRSMTVNAAADILPAAANDKRITPLGRFLRNTFIDELPQFFNVLWGDMSLVGPRPHMLSENVRFEKAISYYHYRERVKPGITGLSQVLGLQGLAIDMQNMKDRVDADIFYLRHWSVKLDIVILFRTMGKVVGL